MATKKRPCQTALIIRNANSYDFGGGERFPVDLARQLSAHGWRTVVISRSAKLRDYARTQNQTVHKGLWWQLQDWGGPRVVLLPLYIIWQLLLIVWYLSLIGRYRPSVVHPQSRDDFIAATVAAKLCRCRVIWTDHADLKYIYANRQTWYKNLIGKLVYLLSKRADTVTIVSRNELDSIKAALGGKAPSNYMVIHNGASSDPVKPVERAESEKPDVIFVATSRLVEAKGIGELIEAFQKVHAEQPTTRLWLCGDGPDAELYQSQAAGYEAIKFFGHVDSPQSYVAAADVLVHPSYHEGFSLSLVEGAKAGKPIIACAVGGNTEIVTNGQNGLLIPPRDPVALAKAMSKLAADPKLRAELGKAGRKRFETEFVFETIVKERFLPIYEKS